MSDAVLTEFDVAVPGGGVLHAYDVDPGGPGEHLTVIWHHGTPNIGTPPEPLFPAAARLGVRWVSYDRPGYGRSTPAPGRDLASAGRYAELVADVLGVERYAMAGHSGGGSHALAGAAARPGRVTAVLSVAGLAPLDAGDLDWFAGMGPASAASLHAAVAGRAAKERFEAAAEFDPEMFTAADHAALAGEWAWLNGVAEAGSAPGSTGLIDDDLAYVAPWGADPAEVRAPVLLLHGQKDRIAPAAHGEWLARRCRSAQLRLTPGDGHISALAGAASGLEWLHAHAG
ncbi:alpha/beta fold hydrolase [Spongiactinospora rosea]|uniref:alpha/beta fold hydrolase n=1 Tax=Spongiactinospora rosea TaxID=2248750 RepID=UPI0018F2B469|nr:alpha/beta fold hydrolase [Spongiactinospora rosea]